MEKPTEPNIDRVEVDGEEQIAEFNQNIQEAAPILLAMMSEQQQDIFAGISPGDWNFSTLPKEVWGLIANFLGAQDKVNLGQVNLALAQLIGKVDKPQPMGYVIDQSSEEPLIKPWAENFNMFLMGEGHMPGHFISDMHTLYPALSGNGSALEKLQNIKELLVEATLGKSFKDICGLDGADLMMAAALEEQDEAIAQQVVDLVLADIVPTLENTYARYLEKGY